MPIINGSTSAENNHVSNSDSNTTSNNRLWSFFGWKSQDNKLNVPRHLPADGSRHSYEEFAFTVPKDPHLSPFRASDSLLKRLPPVKILVS